MDPGIFYFGGEWEQTLVQKASRIDPDRFPNRVKGASFLRDPGICFPGKSFLDFNSLKSPFLGFRVIQTGY